MEKLQEIAISTRLDTHSVHMLNYFAKKYNLMASYYQGAKVGNYFSMVIPLYNRMVAEDYQYLVEVLKSF